MTEEKTKGALRSVSILGSLGSIGTLLAMLAMVRDIWDSIPPELIEDTRVFITVTFVAIAQQAVALWGRWRAVVKIKGLF